MNLHLRSASLALLSLAALLAAACPERGGEGEGEGEGASEGEGEGAGEGEGEGEGAGEGEGEGALIVEPGDPGAADVLLQVRVDTARRAISPLIYGWNGGEHAAQDRATLVRSGGNRLSAYNWENNASNAGSDWCFQNDALLGGPSAPPANAFVDLLDDAAARGTSALVTLPMLDHVAADHDDLGDGGQGPPACVGDVANSGADYLETRFVANHPAKGAPFDDPPDGGDADVYQDEALAYLRAHWPAVPLLVNLDNEPDLWSETHARVHPDALSYVELRDRTLDFAAAVKDVDDEVQVLGFVSYGYAGYMNLQGAPDAAAHGAFIPWFLDELAAADLAQGRRLVDVLDLHWYPEARGDGVRVSSVQDGTGAAARVQAPRSLWDPSYVEDSWIANDVIGGPVVLLPTLFAHVDEHYPGTGLSFTEWNYGGGSHISGALAVAEVLGVFGRESVIAATYYPLAGDEPFARAGLRVFTNHDGAGGAFGATSVSASTDDLERVTVYASDDPLVVVALNKSGADIDAALTLAAPTLTRLERFVLDGDAAAIAAASAVDAVAQNAFRVELPAWSVTVLRAP